MSFFIQVRLHCDDAYVIIFNATICACEKDHQWVEALGPSMYMRQLVVRRMYKLQCHHQCLREWQPEDQGVGSPHARAAPSYPCGGDCVMPPSELARLFTHMRQEHRCIRPSLGRDVESLLVHAEGPYQSVSDNSYYVHRCLSTGPTVGRGVESLHVDMAAPFCC